MTRRDSGYRSSMANRDLPRGVNSTPRADLGTAGLAGGVPVSRPDVAELDLPFVGAESLAGMRYAVSAHGAALGLAGEQLDAMIVIVHELAANAVVHGGGRGRLLLWFAGDAVYCQVSDDGPGIRLREGALSMPPASNERGRGMYFVQQLAQSFHIQTGATGTVVTASVAIDG